MVKQKEPVPFDCPRCGERLVRFGWPLRKGGAKQRYQCTVCGYPFVPKEPEKL